jgi:predicted MFS family arabinose efflux permease
MRRLDSQSVMDSDENREPSQVSLASFVRLVRTNRNFRRLWLAQIVSEIGDWFYTLAIYTLLLQLTGKASSVGLALILQVLPQTFIGPTAGVVNDRVRRKRVMIVADLVRMVVVLAMLMVRSSSTVWLVYPLLLLETIMAAFFEPARSAVIPNITPREDVIVANALGSSTWSVNLTIGATIGGLIAALLGRDAVFVLNGLSFLVSALLIGRMHFDEPHAQHSALRFHDLVDYSPMLEGLRYVRRTPRLAATLFAKAGLLVIGSGWVLFTVMGQRVFPVRWQGLDPQRGAMLGMSLLLGARGLGSMLGPLFTARWSNQRQCRLRLGILGGYLFLAVGYIGVGLAPHLWLACLSLAGAHFGGATIWVFSTTLLQLNTEDEYRGRVFAAELGLLMLTIAIGAYLGGAFLDWGYSPRSVAVATGMAMFVPAIAWAWANRLWTSQRRTAMAEAD